MHTHLQANDIIHVHTCMHTHKKSGKSDPLRELQLLLASGEDLVKLGVNWLDLSLVSPLHPSYCMGQRVITHKSGHPSRSRCVCV